MSRFVDDLQLRLVDITREELLEQLYLDDDDDNGDDFDAESIPSDTRSIVSEDIDLSDQEVAGEHAINLQVESDSDSEADIPLSQLQIRLRQQVRPTAMNLDWNRTNLPLGNPLDFSSPCGIPDFIKDLVDPCPGTLFELFFTDEFFDLLVFQTNLYAQQSDKHYKPTDIYEMKTFIGINLLMGIKKLPSYRDYWSSSKLLHDHYISSLMPVKRFSWLLTHMHMCDNSLQPARNHPQFDKLYKVRPLLAHLQERFSECYLLSENLAIDESMIRFKGRSSLKQYMPKKPIKRGYKVWMLADQSGYCSKFQIYTGKSAEGTEKNLGSRVVTELSRGLENKGHRLYFDNYFNNIPLMQTLQENGIYACGTVNSTRKYMPYFIPDKRMKRGDFDLYMSNSGLMAVKWKDKRSVHLLSNFHKPENVSFVKRKNKDRTVEDIPCPQLLIDYNKYMNGVDKFDQNKSTYEINRKSHKWWHRIFFYFVDAAVVNAHIIHKNLNSEKITMKDFRLSVIESIVTVPKNKVCSTSTTPVTIKKHKPFVNKTTRLAESSHQPIHGSRRRCALCSTKLKQVRTNWMCSRCDVPLCLGKGKRCFELYHSN